MMKFLAIATALFACAQAFELPQAADDYDEMNLNIRLLKGNATEVDQPPQNNVSLTEGAANTTKYVFETSVAMTWPATWNETYFCKDIMSTESDCKAGASGEDKTAVEGGLASSLGQHCQNVFNDVCTATSSGNTTRRMLSTTKDVTVDLTVAVLVKDSDLDAFKTAVTSGSGPLQTSFASELKQAFDNAGVDTSALVVSSVSQATEAATTTTAPSPSPSPTPSPAATPADSSNATMLKANSMFLLFAAFAYSFLG